MKNTRNVIRWFKTFKMVQKVFKNNLFVLSIEINGTKVIRKIFRLEKEIDNQVLEYESNEDYY